ncbi:MAG: hypothetical protein GWO41_04980 [candidate division Zixibacteria bacterium]|nr:hypothetical protein [candidate division Zixibacteria bacterium]NIS15578.1 hypothetical protein [candidate division Zixibacteria bacterium]NIS46054.1 hypothetical protein [candidate division Zixibacteria bacterium]NIT52103.1 hypothetical protein [candidate division Zixibacteria bacterium]NIU14170.1 hypothetical protein [candidate division Zixibacteria bacterium]
MYIGRLLIFALIALLFLPSALLADAASGSSDVGVLFNGLILLVVLVCFFVALKIFSLLRGGELASGWQMLAIAFVLLCLGQLVDLMVTLEIAGLNQAMVATARLAGAFLLLLGVVRIKKVLS